jgi:hypothetical protein
MKLEIDPVEAQLRGAPDRNLKCTAPQSPFLMDPIFGEKEKRDEETTSGNRSWLASRGLAT